MSQTDAGPLFKKIATGDYVRYDPRADKYDLVRARDTPLLTAVASGRVRLSAADRRADQLAPIRQVIAVAMIDTQERATTAGDPTADVHVLLALARLPERPEAPRGVPALGAWARVIEQAAQTPAAAPEQSADVRAVLGGSAVPTAADLLALVVALPRLSVAALRRSRALCASAWGLDAKTQPLIDAIAKHVRGATDRPVRLSHAGAGETLPARWNPVRAGRYRRL